MRRPRSSRPLCWMRQFSGSRNSLVSGKHLIDCAPILLSLLPELRIWSPSSCCTSNLFGRTFWVNLSLVHTSLLSLHKPHLHEHFSYQRQPHYLRTFLNFTPVADITRKIQFDDRFATVPSSLPSNPALFTWRNTIPTFAFTRDYLHPHCLQINLHRTSVGCLCTSASLLATSHRRATWHHDASAAASFEANALPQAPDQAVTLVLKLPTRLARSWLLQSPPQSRLPPLLLVRILPNLSHIPSYGGYSALLSTQPHRKPGTTAEYTWM